MLGSTSEKIVGRTKKPRSTPSGRPGPPHTSFAPSSIPAPIIDWTRWILRGVGDRAQRGCFRPAVDRRPRYAGCRARPRAPRPRQARAAGTSIRVGALHDWPTLRNPASTPLATPREIGILQEHVGRLAAEFLHDSLYCRRRRLRHEHAGARRSRDGDHVDVRMRGERGTHLLAGAIDQVEDTGRHAGIMHDLGEQQRAVRRKFARLQHDRAASGDCRRDLRRDLIQRPVPRRDERADADRFVGNGGLSRAA